MINDILLIRKYLEKAWSIQKNHLICLFCCRVKYGKNPYRVTVGGFNDPYAVRREKLENERQQRENSTRHHLHIKLFYVCIANIVHAFCKAGVKSLEKSSIKPYRLLVYSSFKKTFSLFQKKYFQRT